MSQQTRTSLAFGFVLILLGSYLILTNFFPSIPALFPSQLTWPWIVITIGGGLFVFGLLVGAADMAVPASIVAGIGGILLYQNNSGNWGSWSYLWTLIPGFVGCGTILSAIIKGAWNQVNEGLRMIIISGIMFFIFAAIFHGPNLFGRYWPVLLIGAGIYMIITPLFHRTKSA